MAKARRTAAQKRATNRMIAARKKALRSGKANDAPKRRKRRKSSGKRKAHRHSAKRRAAPKRRRGRRSGKRTRHASKRHSAKRHSGKRKSAKRVAAGRKAARTRKRHQAERHAARKSPRRRRRNRAARDGQKIGKKGRRVRQKRKASGRYKKDRSAARKAYLRRHPRNNRKTKTSRRMRLKPRKRTRRKLTATHATRRLARPGSKRYAKLAKKHHAHGMTIRARENPISWGGVVGVVLLGGIGALGGELTDRWLATHALTPYTAAVPINAADKGSTQVDQSAADVVPAGGLTNDRATAAPMWSNWKRLAAGAAGVILPIGLSAMKMPSGAQTALRSFGLGWGIRTTLKLGTDGVAMLMKGKATGERLFQNEFIASRQLSQGGVPTTSFFAVATGLAGVRKMGAGHTHNNAHNNAYSPVPQTAAGAGCCSECGKGRPCAKNPPAPPAANETGAGSVTQEPPALAAAPARVQPQAAPAFARLPLLYAYEDNAAE